MITDTEKCSSLCRILLWIVPRLEVIVLWNIFTCEYLGNKNFTFTFASTANFSYILGSVGSNGYQSF